MTTANPRLTKALARAGGSVVAIAEMDANDLLAGMTDEQKTKLAAELSPAPPAAPAASAMEPDDKKKGDAADDNDDDDDADAGDGKKKDKMKAEGGDAAAEASAQSRVKAVAKAVAEDDACKGKADLALQMLADDDYAGMSASGIVKILGKQSAGAGGDPEAAARAEMQAAISSTGNSTIDPNSNSGGSAAGGGKSNAQGPWDKAIAKMK